MQSDDVRATAEACRREGEVEPHGVVDGRGWKHERRAAHGKVAAAAVAEDCADTLHTVIEGALPRPELRREERSGTNVCGEVDLRVEVAPPIKFQGCEDGTIRSHRTHCRARITELIEKRLLPLHPRTLREHRPDGRSRVQLVVTVSELAELDLVEKIADISHDVISRLLTPSH